MAAGSEVPQKGVLQATGYEKSVYTPQAVNVPTQAGALWAGVGATALGAVGQFNDILQKSPLNPVVKNQMLAQIQASQQGIAQSRYMAGLPNNLGRTVIGVDAQGNAILSAPAATGAPFAPLFVPKIPPPPGKEPPPAPREAPGTGKEKTEKTEPSTQPKQTDPNDIQIDTTSADTDTSDLAASTNNDYLLRMAAERRAALGGSEAAPGGTPPALTFTNPATGNVQPLQQTAPSMFAGRAAVPPGAPTNQPGNMLLQGAQPPSSQPGSAISQVTQQPGVALANWQAQNIHPVVSPGAVQQAMVDNVSTKFKNANFTYQPNGGVNGEPAIAIDMKDGGHSMLSVSQLASTPWGRSLIQGQNASHAVQALGEQAQTNQPGNMLLQQQPGQPPMQMPGAPQGPPAAPSLPPQQAYPTIASDQGGLQGAPGTSYNPVPYQQAVAQAAASPQNLMAQEGPQAGTRTDIAATQPPPVRTELTPLSDQDKATITTPENIAAARANAKPDPSQPSDDGNPYMGELGPWHLYRDDKNRTNELYALRPGLSSLFKQQRYYLGSDGYQEYELPDTNMRLNVEGEFLGGKGGVVGAPIPDGKTINGSHTFIPLSHEAIVKMPVPQMQQLLELAGKYHNTSGEANSTMQGRLSDLVDSSQRIQRMIDGNTVALNEGMSPAEYNRKAQGYSHAALERDNLAGGWSKPGFGYLPGEELNALRYNYHNMMAQGKPVNKFSDYLEEQVKRMNDSMSETPGRQAAIVPTQQQKEGPSATIYGPWGTGLKLQGGAQDTSSVSPHMEVNKQFGATNPQDQKDAINGLRHIKSEYDRQFKESYEDAVTHNFRLPPQATLYYHALEKAGKFPDQDNQFRDKNGQLVNPWRSPSGSAAQPQGTASASPTPALPQIRSYDTEEFKRLGIKKGDQYLGPDGTTTYTRGQ